MLTLPLSTRVFVAVAPADMRRSFDGLLAIVQDFLDTTILSPGISSSSATNAAIN